MHRAIATPSLQFARTWLPLAALMAGVLAFMRWVRPAVNHSAGYVWLYVHVLDPSRDALQTIFTTPVFYVAVSLILTLERLMPATRTQPLVSVGLLQDAVWFMLDACFQVTVILAVSNAFKAFYLEHLNILTIHALLVLPFWLRLIIGILVSDAAGWLHHWVRHKSSLIWHFHALHHSQREMNLFTDVRYHVVEYAVTSGINVLFITMCTMDPYTVAVYTIFHSWYTKMCHANIRSNFGLVKYVLITPQSHRVHHSIERRHRDKNLGILLSIWDYLLGTQYRGYEEYPETGIDDLAFPLETSAAGVSLMLMPVLQHLYPFQAMGRHLAPLWRRRDRGGLR